ncbi:TolB family protein [Flavihumibacter solisilvae]|uniref:DUF5050 domain-containing protein n=1 Tax=Flavihumibacter solisilvae TaxID=1349421 RepID=A0A0C1L383_9BACT|nr:PD40 domain-containing protein [Flavihumibacter solisilvae]KIC94437.1 hypothetical protein OI18_12595 [Flavihumibacter solisilvae]
MKAFCTILALLFLVACGKDGDPQPSPAPDPVPVPVPVPDTTADPAPPPIATVDSTATHFPADSLSGIIVYESRKDISQADPRNCALGIIDLKAGTAVELKLVDDRAGTVRYQYPRLKKDRSRIYFSSNLHGEGSSRDIYSVATDGSDLKRITNTPDISETYAALSPDESQFVYSATVMTGVQQIFLMNYDGSNLRQLTNNKAYHRYENLMWSEDGSRIIYSVTYGSDVVNGIYSYNLLDNTTERLLPIHAFATSLFPGTGRILYYKNQSQIVELYTINPDGTNALQLTSFGSVTAEGAWSPDGKFVAFGSSRESKSTTNFEIFIALARNPNTMIKINTHASDKYNLDWR